jgi:acyl-coenzyme A thioesterase PaaI-like protein
MSEAESIRERVLQGIALNREPGFHFAGNFLQLSFDRTDPDDSHVRVASGPQSNDRDGRANVGVVAMLADMAMAASIRGGMGPGTRLATVSMTLQFTGLPAKGELQASSRFEGFFGTGASRQGQSRLVMHGEAGPVLHGHGAFIPLEPPPGFKQFPMPRGARSAPPIPEREMTREERAVLRLADATLAGGTEDFLARFWGFARAHRTKSGAACVLGNGMHVANRVHHVQGGILVGLAASTAAVALPPTWSMTGITACFTSPGVGRSLRAASKVVHHGLMTAVVRTEVVGPGRRRVLQALSTHARAVTQ